MLKLRRHFLNDPVAMQALRKLYKEGRMESITSYRVGRIYTRVQKELAETGRRAIEIHKKYCLLDPSGQPSGLAQGKLEFKNPEDEPIHDKEFDELLNEEFEEKVFSLDANKLPEKLLTPEEMGALSPLLSHQEHPASA